MIYEPGQVITGSAHPKAISVSANRHWQIDSEVVINKDCAPGQTKVQQWLSTR